MSTFTAHWHLQRIGRLEVVWFAPRQTCMAPVSPPIVRFQRLGAMSNVPTVEAYKDVKASTKEF